MIELTHAQIKMIRSLKDKKFRDEYGLFVVEGEKLVREALNSSYEVESVYRMEEIGENVMSRISLCATPSPVLALVRIPADRMRSDRSSCGKCGISGGLCLALDSVRDPGNMGTILVWGGDRVSLPGLYGYICTEGGSGYDGLHFPGTH